MIRRSVDRTASRLRYLLVPTFTAMVAPAWAVLPPSEQFAAEPGVQATVSTLTTLPDWLATAQFDSVCTPKVRTDVPHVPQE
ncbi:hypothetical protein [Stenotrophomonas rhizophila]|uniref:hypothetical protein n=1 Tax=Stenotrophomonas rhizophila TaxID=216778 RepID=UPI0028ADC576|nr:hypothetical protein [Stenotrophomonas rhizophila]